MAERAKSYPKKIGGLVGDFLKKIKKQTLTQDLLLHAIWLGIAGERVAMHTRPELHSGGRLIVMVESSAWMNELTFLKEKIKISAKNSFSLHGISVEDVIFRLGKTK